MPAAEAAVIAEFLAAWESTDIGRIVALLAGDAWGEQSCESPVPAGAAVVLFVVSHGVVIALLVAGCAGAVIGIGGAPLPH